MSEFPRMLYRLIPDGEPLQFEDPKNTMTVSDHAALSEAISEGWLVSPHYQTHKNELKAVQKEVSEHEKRIKRKIGA